MAKEISDIIDLPSVIEHSVKIDKDKLLDFMLHSCQYNKHQGRYKASMPSEVEYIYIDTAIATVLEIQCKCGRRDNVTDYSSEF